MVGASSAPYPQSSLVCLKPPLRAPIGDPTSVASLGRGVGG
jgi:hypothetical protein